jgi:hypothetical protein
MTNYKFRPRSAFAPATAQLERQKREIEPRFVMTSTINPPTEYSTSASMAMLPLSNDGRHAQDVKPQLAIAASENTSALPLPGKNSITYDGIRLGCAD